MTDPCAPCPPPRAQPAPPILGVVLAGGRSRRFGADKAAALWQGQPLIAHALAGLAPHVAALAVAGRDYPGVSSLADWPEPGLGPLGGLCGALHHAAGAGFAGVLVTGCDMPLFPPALAAALLGDGPAVLEGAHLVGWWPADLAGALAAHLAQSPSRAVRLWIAAAGARVVRPGDIGLGEGALPNINTPADLADLAARPL